jgi:hypothetical protein
MTAATFKKSSEDRYEQSEDQNRRKDNVCENAEVRILSFRSDLDQKEQNDTDETGDDDRAANETDVIAEQAGWLGRWLGMASVIRGLRDV